MSKQHRNKSLVGIALFFILSASNVACQTASSNTALKASIDVHLEEVLRIGDGEHDEAQDMFGELGYMAMDHQGAHIYVYDRLGFHVKVYNRQGQYIRTIGGPGQGPGEFRAVREITITKQDILLTGDMENARITKFSRDGDLLDTHELDYKMLMYPFYIRPWGDNQFLHASLRPDRDQLFHVYTQDFQEQVTAFGEKHLFGDMNEEVYQRLDYSYVGSLLVEGNQLLYAPQYYQGQIYIFEKYEDTWAVADTLSGYVNQPEGITLVTEPPLEFPHVSIQKFGSGPMSAFVLHNESFGLWRLQNGHLVHFTFIRQGEERVFGIEVYDEANQFLGYGEINRVQGQGIRHTARLFERPKWKDESDTFYFFNREQSAPPMVIAYTLTYTIPASIEN